MSFEFKTGFDELSDTTLREIWEGEQSHDFIPTHDITVSATGRRGGKALRFTGNGVNGDTWLTYRAYEAASDEIVLGGAFDVIGSPDNFVVVFLEAITAYNSYDAHAYLHFSGTTLTVYDSAGAAVGSTTVTFSDYPYIEVYLNCTTGVLKVWVNEELVIDLTGESFDFSSGVINYYGFRGYDNMTGSECVDIDDFYIDTNTRRGDLAILYWPPTSDVSVDFTPSTGTDNYALVDEAPENDTDYNESALVGDTDIYGHSSTLGSITGDILAVDVLGRVNVPDGGVGSGIIPKLKIGGTEYSGTQIDGTTVTKEKVSGEFLLSPATGMAFTQAEIEAMDFGWEIGS